MIKKVQYFFEKQVFGVCSEIGDKFGIAPSSIRLLFIYASFFTYGSPVLIYLGLAFIMNIRKHLRRHRNTVWY